MESTIELLVNPFPVITDFDAFNEDLLRRCDEDHEREHYLHGVSIKELWEEDKRALLTLTSFMTSLRRVELLVLDEIGFITLHREASELLFQIVSDCYEQESLIITSNLEFSQWNTVFGNDKLTAAMIDRLIHHSHILVFSGPGHRLEESIRRQRKSGPPRSPQTSWGEKGGTAQL